MNNEKIHVIDGNSLNSFKNIVRKRIFHGKNGERYNSLIEELCKLVLDKSMNRNTLKYYEVGVLAELNNRSIRRIMYGDTSLYTINDEEYVNIVIGSEQNSLVFVHNHPNNSILSLGDILELYQTFSIAVVVAIGNSGKPISYAYRISENTDKYLRKYMEMCNIAHEIGWNKVYEDIINNPEKYGLVIKN